MTTLTTIITKLKPTSDYCPATGKTFIIELSNGELFKVSTEELIGKYCYTGTEDWKTGYDDEKIERMMGNNFQELIGVKY
jgi:hypothetical protein